MMLDHYKILARLFISKIILLQERGSGLNGVEKNYRVSSERHP